MPRYWLAAVLVLTFVGMVGCDDDAGKNNNDDAGADTGSGADGALDVSLDGVGDLCVPEEGQEPSETVGCNGEAVFSDTPAGEFGGVCTVEDGGDPQGNCQAGETCEVDPESGQGICTSPCDPEGNPVATGDCPEGSRCIGGNEASSGFCLPDCREDGDCATGVCDADGSCGAPAIPVDAGVDTGLIDAGI